MSDSNNKWLSDESLRRFLLGDLDQSDKFALLKELDKDKEAAMRFHKIRDELIAESPTLYEIETDIVDSVLMGESMLEEKDYVDLRIAIDSEFKSFVAHRKAFIQGLHEVFLRRDLTARLSQARTKVIRFKRLQTAMAASVILGISTFSLYYIVDQRSSETNVSSSDNAKNDQTQTNQEDNGRFGSSNDSMLQFDTYTATKFGIEDLMYKLAQEYVVGGWSSKTNQRWIELNNELDSFNMYYNSDLSFSPFFIQYVDRLKRNPRRIDNNFDSRLLAEIDSLQSSASSIISSGASGSAADTAAGSAVVEDVSWDEQD